MTNLLQHARQVMLWSAIAVFVAGCEQTWSLTITDLSDLAHPGVCLSAYGSCVGPAPSLASFDIYEVDEGGSDVKEMWSIVPASTVKLKRFKYGTPPEGWREVVPAQPLELGKLYRMGIHYVRIVKEDGRISAHVSRRVPHSPGAQ